MTNLVTADDLGVSLVKLLGLPEFAVTKLEIILEAGHLAFVRCEYRPDAETLQEVGEDLKKKFSEYYLVDASEEEEEEEEDTE